MNILNVIREDALAARKAKHRHKAIILTTLIAEVCRNIKEPNEDEVFAGIKKFLKNIDKSIEICNTPNLQYERNVVGHYLSFQQLVSSDHDFEKDFIAISAENPDKVLNEKTIGWFVGQIMKANKGMLNPAAVKSFLESKHI